MNLRRIATYIAVALALPVSPGAAGVLDQADARIQKYRTGHVEIRLIGPEGAPLSAGQRVHIEQTRHKFLFGSNIFMLDQCKTPTEEAAYEKQFSDLLNYATAPFYWWVYEPREGWPNYTDTDRVVSWCDAHRITIKGHPLAWSEGQPKWLPPDPSLAMQLQLARVGSCVGHFMGEINIWDVVNEATHFDVEPTRQNGPTLTEAIRQMGVPAYLRAAFQQARNANPAATLVINDYVTSDEYAANVLSRLGDESGRPLYDVVGIQCHQHREEWTADKIWEICERFAKFGKPLHFTEATILSGQHGHELKKQNPQFQWASTPQGEKEQAEEVARFYTVLFSHPSVEAITWWDFSDQGAWQGAPGGLLREDMSAKPAYQALLKLIKGTWWTKADVATGAQGKARIHGFFGDYKAVVQENGRELSGTFSFDQHTTEPLEVKLQ